MEMELLEMVPSSLPCQSGTCSTLRTVPAAVP